MNNILFICNQAENRSRTAYELYKERKSVEVKYAGFFSEIFPVYNELLEWADVIIVFEKNHAELLRVEWPDIWFNKRVIDLDIVDEYRFMQEKLVELIVERMDYYEDLF